MNKMLFLTILFIPMAFSDVKQLTCPFFSDKMSGLLDDSAWRIDKFIFSTDDFSKDTPNLTHHFVVNYKTPDDSKFSEFMKFPIEKSYSAKYSISPTHLSFSNPENSFFSINRSTLELTFAGNTSKCSISDVEIPDNNIF